MRDNKKTLAWVSLAVCFVLLPVPLFAHHGTNISYDRNASYTVKGVVTDYRHINPHPALFIDVTDEAGKVTNWTIEVAPTPYTLALRGWNKRRTEEGLKAGTVLTVTMAPSRAGTPSALLRNAVNEENLTIFGEDLDGVSVGRDEN
jgi:hypothetical protein